MGVYKFQFYCEDRGLGSHQTSLSPKGAQIRTKSDTKDFIIVVADPDPCKTSPCEGNQICSKKCAITGNPDDCPPCNFETGKCQTSELQGPGARTCETCQNGSPDRSGMRCQCPANYFGKLCENAHCTWGPWKFGNAEANPWVCPDSSGNPVKCGETGKFNLKRSVTTRQLGEGNKCEGSSEKKDECKGPECPINCRVAEWAEWGPCTCSR
eukprot:449481_1